MAFSPMNLTRTLPVFFDRPTTALLQLKFFVDNSTNSTNSTRLMNRFSYQNFLIRFLSIYALLLVIIGTLGNLLTIIILCRRNLRRYVTMQYLIAVSVCDTISLYGWNLNNFYKFTISSNFHNIEELSLTHCRLLSYMTFVGLQLSSWCLTAVSVDRCLSLYFLTWKHTYGKLERTKYHIAVLTVICLLLNSHILFLNGYRTGLSTNQVRCYATRTNPFYIFPQWERVHLVLYNLFPFSMMCICNAYIIHITVRSARIRVPKNGHTSRHRQLTLMLMLVTFAFVLLTLPSCIYFVFFRHRMPKGVEYRTTRYLVQISLGGVQFTSHAINFFLYCFSTNNFRNELSDFLREILFCILSRKPPSRVAITTTVPTRPQRISSQHSKKRFSWNHRNFLREPTIERHEIREEFALKHMQSALINNDE